MVFIIDFAKAFDLENHKYGVGGSLLDWCRGYLTNHRKRGVVKGDVSYWLTVTSGMSQGSLLGPLFFIIHINDLPEVISGDSSFALYADDSKLYKIINAPEDI